MAEAFTGFPPSVIGFLAGLAADNTRAYFDRNRGTYASDVAAPLRALVIAVGQRLREGTGQDVCFEPTVGKSLFRINRDTRFSADKTRTTRGSMPSGGPGSPTPAGLFRSLRSGRFTEICMLQESGHAANAGRDSWARPSRGRVGLGP